MIKFHDAIKLRAIIVLIISSLHAYVYASPVTDSLVLCVGDNTSGKDRKDLAK